MRVSIAFCVVLKLLSLPWGVTAATTDRLPIVVDVELQPLVAQATRVAQSLELLGAPLNQEQLEGLRAAAKAADPVQGVKQIQAILDPLCLVGVNINPESRVKAHLGPAPAKLMQQGWRVFLVKVHNEAPVTAELRCLSANAAPLYKWSSGSAEPKQTVSTADVSQRWMDLAMYGGQPLSKTLSGLKMEYRIIELYSRDSGNREATLNFDVGQGTQELGFRSDVPILFDCQRAVNVVFDVQDDDGSPTTGKFGVKDRLGRPYPAPARRQLPDFFFQEQIYRRSGDSVILPPGNYEVSFSRGPEYRILKRQITVPDQVSHRESFKLQRWINLAAHGWFSGDHHIHAAGCAHYDSPTQGVQPHDMLQHIQGEDLHVGCMLSWGPCWYYQKQFFTAKNHHLSTPRYLMRYDVEVSGFPSSHAGHLCLLRLKEDDYPGTTRIEEWPSWNLPILQWAKAQGSIVGYPHSGAGLTVSGTSLPSYEMPAFDSIGANEYIVDVVHDACDFISAVDTPIVWELSIWYHTLNCGYTTRISGETDFPCGSGERVGIGRSYVKPDSGPAMDAETPLDFDRWIEGICDGRSYCSDGLSHLFDFQINDLGVGEPGANGRASVLAVKSGDPLKITCRAAAMLAERPREDIRGKNLTENPMWHVERARVGDTRQVPVELIVNGEAVAKQLIEADGRIHELKFDHLPQQSSWVALRVFPSSHTNPIFVELDDKPIRASRKSAQWCLDAVDRCWGSKQGLIRPAERDAAAAAYEVARQTYRKILAETLPESK